jgi:hypothetical protein
MPRKPVNPERGALSAAERKRRQRERAFNADGDFVTVTRETVEASLATALRALVNSSHAADRKAADRVISQAAMEFEPSLREQADAAIRARLVRH